MALEVKSSTLFTHPNFFLMGCRQAVRHRPLTATVAGSNPATPAKQLNSLQSDGVSPSGKALDSDSNIA